MDWTTPAAVGQVVAAAVAVSSALFVAVQIRAARRSADLASMLTFNKDVAEQERRLLGAEKGVWNAEAFVDYLNLLESYATAMRAGLLNRATRTLVSDKLVDALAMIQASERSMQQWSLATSTPMALSDLTRFQKLRRADIERVKRGLATVGEVV